MFVFELEKELELIHPLAKNVIISVTAKSHGTEEFSAGGIAIGLRKEGELPTTGKVVKIGRDVDPAYLNKTIALPQHLKPVTLPSVLQGKTESIRVDTKLVTTHSDNICVLYSDL